MKPSWWLVLFISILVSSSIIVAIVLVKFWQVQETNTMTISSSADLTAVDLESIPEGNQDLLEEIIDADTASDWLGFNSRTLPITFSYPSDWQLWEGTTPLFDYIQIADFESQPLDALADTVPGHKLEVAIVTQPTELSLEKWIKQTDQEFTGTVGTMEDLLIDGFSAKLDYQVLGYSTFGSIYIPLGDGTDRVLLVSLYGPEQTFAELRPLLDSIIETIQIKS